LARISVIASLENLMSIGGKRARLPGEEYRDCIVLLVAIVGGLIPETGSEERAMNVSSLMPPLLAGLVLFYYRFIPLSWKIFVAVVLSCGSLFGRWLITWLAVGFHFPFDSGVLGWPARSCFFYASLLGPCLIVIPFHFIIVFAEESRLEGVIRGR
jgi:hypothetical protein